jgi:serine/threonine-protein kinase
MEICGLKANMPEVYQKLGRYHIIREIAHGGMATVYRGILIGVEGFEKDVAIKKIQPYWSQQKEFVDMLIDEARILLHLHHPNIVEVIELGKENDVYFIVMEYVDGFDLRTITKKLQAAQQIMPTRLACAVIKQVCLGLEFAHHRKGKSGEPLNIVHRDISPQNILMSRDGHVKITDFGIAKVRGKSTETAAGFLKGKFSYMSPEQATGATIDALTDIFALGAVLYELLTGVKCFDGQSDIEIIEKVKRVTTDFSLINDPQLKQIVQRALAQNSANRYQTASALRHDIETFEKENNLAVDADDLKDFLEQHLATEIQKAIANENAVREHTHTPYKHTLTTMPLTETPGKASPESISVQQKSQYSVVVGPEGYASDTTPSATRIHEQTLVSEPEPTTGTHSHSTQSLFKLYRSPVTKFHLKKAHVLALVLTGVLCFGLIRFLSKPSPTQPTPTTPPVLPVTTTEIVEQPPVKEIAEQPVSPVEEKVETQLPETPPLPQAKLSLSVLPDSAHIDLTLNGKTLSTRGRIDEAFTMTKDTLSLPVTISLNGYEPQTLDLTFDKEHLEQKQNVELSPLKFGLLKIISRPWGFVTVEGIGSKQGMISLFKAPVGEHNILAISRDRKIRVTHTIDVPEGTLVECTVIFSGIKPSFHCQ